MDTESYYKLLFLIILVFSSGFFSGSEVALFSFDQKKLKDIKKNNKYLGSALGYLLDNPRNLLVTILIGNTLVNVWASVISVNIAIKLAEYNNWDIGIVITSQIILVTVVILIFGEIFPKIIASRFTTLFAKSIAIPLYWINIILYPLSKTITELIKIATSHLKIDKSSTAILGSELTDLASLGVETGTIEEEEQELIDGIVSFRTVTAREVMTPRVDMAAVSTENTFEELINLITDSGHSRIPLFEGNLDNIIGIIYAKDLLPFLSDNKEKENISLLKIARKPMFIPESKIISDLMHEFQSKNMHLGIVVDEYGGTAGLVSLEDILEEIVGDIQDEYDKEETEITKISNNTFEVLGKVPISEINELLEIDLSSENDDYDTIGGFIFTQTGTIPEIGLSFDYNGINFTVKEVENKRINKILIKILDDYDSKGNENEK
ncbi:MAG TPA: hemolysin family protein [Melioribacteraceae bacterium]|nr:hemolysin family protein [Melioribacteraceae bacterium]